MTEEHGPARSRLSALQLLSRARRSWLKRLRAWKAFGSMSQHFVPHVRRRRRRLAAVALLAVGYMCMRLLEPWPLKLILDNVLLARPLPESLASIIPDGRLPTLYVLALAIIGIALLGGLFYYFRKTLGAILGQEVAADLRLDLYSHIQRLCFNFHDRRRTGDLLVRLTSDVRMLREALVSLPIELTEHLLLTVGMLTVMFIMDWQLTLVALLLLPGLAMLMRKYRRPMKRAIRKQRDREGHLATIASETLGAVKIVQGYRRERDEIRRFGSENRRSLRSGVKAAKLEAKFKWTADLAVAIVIAVIVAAASRRVLAGELSPGDLIVFVAYLRIYSRPLRRISRTTERIVRATSAGERIVEILETTATVRDAPSAVQAPRFQGRIDFEDVSFAYRKDHSVLDGVSLSIQPGERVGIVGSTGSGKTTLASLVPRFYDVSGGKVCIDGTDVRDFTLDSLRKQISIVFQEPVLFATSIAENIGYGRRNANMDDIVKAARRAGIHKIISRLPHGYDTVVGERGGTLSGGQRQCVAIARAMIRNAPIVILDEPTTGLDAESAVMVIAALRRLVKGKTVLMISHQLSNIEEADHIVVMAAGRVMQQGTHATLAAADGLYRTLQRHAGSSPR